MKAKLINVGRKKVNKTIEIKKHIDVFKELKKHLMSKEIELTEGSEPNLYDVVVGGFRTAGQIEFS